MDNGNEFDIELANLIRQERRKEVFEAQPIGKERSALLSAFYDHYAAITDFTAITTVDDFLASIQQDGVWNGSSLDKADEPRLHELQEIMDVEVERYPELLRGEMRVTGEGIYFCAPDPSIPESDNDDMGWGDIEFGDELIGDIENYEVDLMPAYESYRAFQDGAGSADLSDGEAPEEPSLVLYLTNVAIQKADGTKINLQGTVFVPFNYPSLDFDKIIRQSDSARALIEEQQLHVDLKTHFKSDFIIGTCSSMENTMNYMDLSLEEHSRKRKEFQKDLETYMKVVRKDKKLLLSSPEATLLSGAIITLNKVEACYLDPVLIKFKDEWRVAHAFGIDDGDAGLAVHILPEHISDDIRYIEEE